MRGERDVLNCLCPQTEIKPLFEGGIRLERQTWLAGHPPRISFTGNLEAGFTPMIDGLVAAASEHGYVADGWDSIGDHQLLYAGQNATYSLRGCVEDWPAWAAYDSGTGSSVCGALTGELNTTELRQLRVPATNPVLIGREPGQIFYCKPLTGVTSPAFVARPPFDPVWALPRNPAHLDKRVARVIPVGRPEPVKVLNWRSLNRGNRSQVAAWCAAISDAGRKGLNIDGSNAEALVLWRGYRAEAKRLRKTSK
jgi:hypothetical protein